MSLRTAFAIGAAATVAAIGLAAPAASASTVSPTSDGTSVMDSSTPDCNSGLDTVVDGRRVYLWNNCEDKPTEVQAHVMAGQDAFYCMDPGVHEIVSGWYSTWVDWTGEYC